MKVQTIEATQHYWNSFAGWYQANLETATDKFFRAMLPFLELDADSIVLETACGTGKGIQTLLDLTPATQIVGTDLSEVMVELAKKKLEVDIQLGNNEALAFEDSSFSHYISNMSLHIVPDPSKMLAEAYRVLRPGGLCAVSVIGVESSFIMMAGKANLLAKRAAADPEARTYLHLSDPNKVLTLIFEAGFTQPLHFSEIFHFPLKTPQSIADFICTVPAVAALETCDPELYREVKAAMLEEAATYLESRLLEFRCEVFVMKKP
jgi:ubiquinone/menaquinone biosynthesis C-methylase UbiE